MAVLKQQVESFNSLSCTAKAPAIVFMQVASADGAIDKKAVKRLTKLLHFKDYKILVDAMRCEGSSLASVLDLIQSNQIQPLEELRKLRSFLDSACPEETALSYKTALLKLAHDITVTSGGLFVSKLSQKQKVAIVTIASELGLLDDINDVPANNSARAQLSQIHYATTADLPDHLYPVLKPAGWADDVNSDVVMSGINTNRSIHANDPVVGYALDLPEAIEFLVKTSLDDSLSITEIHDKALQNLNRRLLAATQWHELSHQVSEMTGNVASGLVLNGDYFSSEALLSRELLNLAHKKLDASMMMVIAPERGKLFAAKITNEDEQTESELLAFASAAVTNYFKPEQAPISPNVWIVRDGLLVGQIEGMDGIISTAKQYAEEQAQQEEDKLIHTAKAFADDSGVAVKVDVVAHDIDILLRNMQHLIRGYVQQAVQHQQFKGVLSVTVDIRDPEYQPEMKIYLNEQLDDMSQFLSNQFKLLGLACKDDSEIQLSCYVER
ncbi:MAG: hypothetical protein K0U68_11245 [Gammaproteobacteria bacterium]|nr:hypothetical protein [Gammaproteobacteria bacterium]